MNKTVRLMLMGWLLLSVLGSRAAGQAPALADWPQFRGPEGNGIATGGPALANAWPTNGLTKLWESEKLQSDTMRRSSGFASPSVVDGRVYQYMHYQDDEPEGVKVPEDTLKQWGAKGVSPEVLETLKSINLGWSCDADAWFEKNKIPEDARKLVCTAFPSLGKGRDVFLCLDASNGKTLWKKEYEGKAFHRVGVGSTITVAGGRCYVVGSGVAYCLDAKDGREIWSQRGMWTKLRKNYVELYASSFRVVENVAIVLCSPVVAFDAEKGTILWSQPKASGHLSSPVIWRKDGKTYVICTAPDKVTCVELKTGNVAWEIQNGYYVINNDGTPAVSDDRMVLITHHRDGQRGMRCYSLSTNKADLAWFAKDFPLKDEGCNPLIHNGYVYTHDHGVLFCFKLDSGVVAWEQKISALGYYDQFRFPVLVDGKLFLPIIDARAPSVGGLSNMIVMIAPSPDKYIELARAPISMMLWHSPVIAGGRLYARNNKNITCYDLPKAHDSAVEK